VFRLGLDAEAEGKLISRSRTLAPRSASFSLFGEAPMAVVAFNFNVLPSPESEMSLSPLELINDEFKKIRKRKGQRTAKEARKSK
jgi:hypothetical protein